MSHLWQMDHILMRRVWVRDQWGHDVVNRLSIITNDIPCERKSAVLVKWSKLERKFPDFQESCCREREIESKYRKEEIALITSWTYLNGH